MELTGNDGSGFHVGVREERRKYYKVIDVRRGEHDYRNSDRRNQFGHRAGY